MQSVYILNNCQYYCTLTDSLAIATVNYIMSLNRKIYSNETPKNIIAMIHRSLLHKPLKLIIAT